MTPGARQVLADLAADEDIDLAQEGWLAYVGNRQTTVRVVKELLGLCALKILYRDGFRTAFTTYGINDIGRALLRRPELEAELQKVFYSRNPRSFEVIDDRIKFLRKPRRRGQRK